MVAVRAVSNYFVWALGPTSGTVRVAAAAGVQTSSSAVGLVALGVDSDTNMTPDAAIVLSET